MHTIGIIIRPIRLGDGQSFVELTDRVTAETDLTQRAPGEPSGATADPEGWIGRTLRSGMVVVAEVEGALVGWASCIPGDFFRNWTLGQIGFGMLRSHSAQDLGLRLLDAIADWARGAGLRRLELTVAAECEQTRVLFRSAGYEEEAVHRWGLRIDGRWVDEIAMAKLLGPDPRRAEPEVPAAPEATPTDAAQIVVRPLDGGDAEALVRFDGLLRAETPFHLRTADERFRLGTEAAAFLERIAKGGLPVIGGVIEAEGGPRIVGFVTLDRPPWRRVRHNVQLGTGVLRDYWGVGLGRRLMEAAEIQARDAGVSVVRLRVAASNDRARRFYERLGYRSEGLHRARLRLEDGFLDYVAMAKAIG